MPATIDRRELSSTTRWLSWLTAAAFGLLGLVLFVAPAWAAPRFAWKVSPFVTMTIGGWSLGTAWAAGFAARRSRWSEVRAPLVFLWSFSVLESGVLAWFHAKVVFHVLTWPYFVALGLGVLCMVVGLRDVVRLSPASDEPRTRPMPGSLRGIGAFFTLFVAFLAVVALVRPGARANRRIFPEPLSPFTVRAFGAFYLSLGIATVSILWERTLAPFLGLLWGGLGLVVPLTVAAFVYIGVFDFSAHPLQALYLAAYLAAFVFAVGVLVWARRSAPAGADATAPAASRAR